MENEYYATQQNYSSEEKTLQTDNSNVLSWPPVLPEQNQSSNFLNMLAPSELDMSNLVDHSIWPTATTSSTPNASSYPLEPLNNVFASWMPQVKQEWPVQNLLNSQQKAQDAMFPPTPPESTPLTFTNELDGTKNMGFNPILYPMPRKLSREMTPPSSATNSPPKHSRCQLSTFDIKRTIRRKSDETINKAPTRTYRRRASSHPSVASVVSLSAHEPVTRYIDGIEHITFLYSHERQVREYTVRTDVQSVNLSDISIDFRAQNAIYPRANVSKEEYDGNRWEYETSCNRLGWELCWLNKNQLCGRRGLIQRAVDSYRNRHAEMRSRRVTRQEKVANGTLRKRRVKKSSVSLL
jgi:hypothetical protein